MSKPRRTRIRLLAAERSELERRVAARTASQGIGVREPTTPDQPPVPRRRPAKPRPARREFEYVRHGTVDLLAGFRVNDGQVCGMVRLQHRSREFCELLAVLD